MQTGELSNLSREDCGLINLTQLSRYVCEIIDSSYMLQYRIDLLLAGLEDLGYGVPSVRDKRELLQKYVSARDTLEPEILACTHEDHDYPDSDLYRYWDIFDGLITQVTDTGVKFVQLPSPIRGLSYRQWELPIVSPIICGVDPSQDLLLAVCFIDNTGYVVALVSTSEKSSNEHSYQ